MFKAVQEGIMSLFCNFLSKEFALLHFHSLFTENVSCFMEHLHIIYVIRVSYPLILALLTAVLSLFTLLHCCFGRAKPVILVNANVVRHSILLFVGFVSVVPSLTNTEALQRKKKKKSCRFIVFLACYFFLFPFPYYLVSITCRIKG